MPASLPRALPEQEGVDPRAIRRLLDRIDQSELEAHSFMLLRNGNVIAETWWEPYRPDLKHMLFSLSKSFTSSAIGLAVDEGLLTVDQTVASFFPDQLPPDPSPFLLEMTVRDLLVMGTGHDPEPQLWQAEGSWVSYFLAQPIALRPGSRFAYNTPATYMLSAILTKVTGELLLDYLTSRIMEPLGIEGATWELSRDGIHTGGYGLNIKTEDIAKFGQLYLQKGEWEGKQLIPSSWIDEATSKQISNGTEPDNDWHQGYGYQFWRCTHNAYRADGAFGQFCVVLPDHNAVIVTTGGTQDMGGLLKMFWEELLPGFGANVMGSSEPLVTNRSLVTPLGAAHSALESKIDGRTFRFAEGEIKDLKITCRPDQIEVALNGGETRATCGYQKWHTEGTVAGAYAWTSEDTLAFRIAAIETSYIQTFELKVEKDGVTLSRKLSCNFGPTDLAAVHGKE